ncbi:MAG TPA: hypothetical protein VFV87_20000 [Pirellulaceae bacterium]|nr:hypothetical protein [Pirellulaceae bacterium]
MYRFTIRDVLLATVIAGLAVGWWVDHRRQSAARIAAETKARSLEAKEAQWRAVNLWLSAAMDQESTGFGLSDAEASPRARTGDSR